MRILCVSAPLPGHLDWGGYLATAAELMGRGHEVCWASGSRVAQAVERAGISFHEMETTGWRWPPPPPLRPPLPGVDAREFQRRRQLRALDQWFDTERVTTAVRDLGALIADFRPDLLVSEMFIAAAGVAAELADIPLIIAGWPAPSNTRSPAGADSMVGLARNRLQEVLNVFGATGVNWTRHGPPALLSPHLHLSYWSRRWFGGDSAKDSAAHAPTRHVGGVASPSLPPLATLPAPDDAPWALITLGTSFNQDPPFFVAAAQAAEEMNCLPIVVSGSEPDSPLHLELAQRLPPFAQLLTHVDFRAVLPYIGVAIHHGGAGTTHALVTHAVPQIVVPHAADQGRQAQGVARSGVGFHIAPRQTRVDNLVNALTELLPDRSPYRAAAHNLQAEFADLGGIPRAATLIEEINR